MVWVSGDSCVGFFFFELVVVVFCFWVLLMMGLGLRRGGFR